ncbi:hypothetical protein KCU87_g477, partial [Aureobasidium melanogenum]
MVVRQRMSVLCWSYYLYWTFIQTLGVVCVDVDLIEDISAKMQDKVKKSLDVGCHDLATTSVLTYASHTPSCLHGRQL